MFRDLSKFENRCLEVFVNPLSVIFKSSNFSFGDPYKFENQRSVIIINSIFVVRWSLKIRKSTLLFWSRQTVVKLRIPSSKITGFKSLRFFLLEHLKSVLYKTQTTNIDVLKQNAGQFVVNGWNLYLAIWQFIFLNVR